DIAKSRPGFQHGPVFGWPAQDLKPYRTARMRRHAGGYFIRLTVHDRIGVFAAVAKRMADNEISLESIVQRSDGASDAEKTAILGTHENAEAAVRKAGEGITTDCHLTSKPQVIRIERAARGHSSAAQIYERFNSSRTAGWPCPAGETLPEEAKAACRRLEQE